MGVEGSKRLFYISICCFVLSFISHFITYIGINPQRYFPPIWILHILIFIVLPPAVRIYNKTKVNFSRWMVIIGLIFFIYAGTNFMIFINLTKDGSPEIQDGRYVLSLHGKITIEINEDEYNKYQMYEVRGFSGHWMVFYLFPSFVYLWAIKNNGVDDEVWNDE